MDTGECMKLCVLERRGQQKEDEWEGLHLQLVKFRPRSVTVSGNNISVKSCIDTAPKYYASQLIKNM